MTNSLTPVQFYRDVQVPGWRVTPSDGSGGRGLAAHARFATGSFARGTKFVSRINELAEAAGHHPDVELTYPTVTIRLTTHDAGGTITEKDAALASEISAAADELGIAAEPVPTAIHDKHLEMLSAQHMGTLATLYRDGRPQLSNVAFHYADGVIAVSVTDSRAKVRNLRRDPRATMHVMGADGWSWAAAEGIVTLGAATRAPDDAAADELVAVYRAVAGEHPDWAEFRSAMVAEQRLVLRLTVLRTYGSS